MHGCVCVRTCAVYVAYFCLVVHALYRAFILAGTRETAFLSAIISAGIAREVARKCREQALDLCGCGFLEGDSLHGGCGDNDVQGVEIAKQFTDTSINDLTDPFSLMSLHNNEVGRKVSLVFACCI